MEAKGGAEGACEALGAAGASVRFEHARRRIEAASGQKRVSKR
jgi:hypothetical protein